MAEPQKQSRKNMQCVQTYYIKSFPVKSFLDVCLHSILKALMHYSSTFWNISVDESHYVTSSHHCANHFWNVHVESISEGMCETELK